MQNTHIVLFFADKGENYSYEPFWSQHDHDVYVMWSPYLWEDASKY